MKQLSYLLFACLCAFSLAQPFASEIVDGGVYIIEYGATGKVLDIRGESTAAGAELILYTKHGGLNQQFRFDSLSGDDSYGYKITAVHSGLVLDVSGESEARGTPIIQYPYHRGYNQMWGHSEQESCSSDEGDEGEPVCETSFDFSSIGSTIGPETETIADGTRIVQGGVGGSSFRLIRVN